MPRVNAWGKSPVGGSASIPPETGPGSKTFPPSRFSPRPRIGMDLASIPA